MKKYYHGKKVLITGAGGFIGSHLAYALTEIGAQVYGSIGPRANSSRILALKDKMALLQADLRDIVSAKNILRESKPSIVFNLASATTQIRSSEQIDTFMQNTYSITHNVLSAVRESPVQRFIQVGSMEEYGSALAPYYETMWEEPVTPYGLGKLFATQATLMQGRVSTIGVTVIRPSAVFGEGQDFGRMLIPNIIKAGLDGKDFDMHAGEHLRDFLYVGDLVEGLLLTGSRQEAAGEIINLGAGSGIPVREVAEMTNEAMGNPITINFGALPYPPLDRDAYLDCSKAKKLLDWHARTPLKDALKKTAAWYHTH